MSPYVPKFGLAQKDALFVRITYVNMVIYAINCGYGYLYIATYFLLYTTQYGFKETSLKVVYFYPQNFNTTISSLESTPATYKMPRALRLCSLPEQNGEPSLNLRSNARVTDR